MAYKDAFDALSASISGIAGRMELVVPLCQQKSSLFASVGGTSAAGRATATSSVVSLLGATVVAAQSLLAD